MFGVTVDFYYSGQHLLRAILTALEKFIKRFKDKL